MSRWKAQYSEKHNIHWVEDENGTTICDLYHKLIVMDPKEDQFYRKPDAETNVHKFAAADDMLEALEEARGWVELCEDLCKDVTEPLAMIDAVLAKAKGGKS